MYITFAQPQYLFLLLTIPLIVLVHVITLKNTKKRALKFANFEAIARVRGVEFFSKNIVITLLSLVITTLLILSVSGLTLHIQAKASSFSFVLAIDTSRSMEAQDMSPNRLEAAKATAREFIDAAPMTTEMGIISFSGNSYIEQDLTGRKDQMKAAIDNVQQSSIEGTDIYEAIITSTNLLRSESSRAIILLSDGQMTVGETDEVIRYANNNDILIHSIVIGTEEGGKTSYGVSKVDEESLQALAYNTEGEFFRARDKETLSESFNGILKLTNRKVSINLAPYLILAAILFFIATYVLINTRYRIFP